jgi:PAS domain S-box-containing protein
VHKSPEETFLEGGIPLGEFQRAREAQRLDSFIEALPVAVFVTDASGHPCFSNQLSRELLGKGAIDTVGSAELAKTYDAFLENSSTPYPAERMPLVRALRGITSSVDDMEIQHPDRRVPLEVHGAPILSATGEVAFAVATFRDITARKQLEARLRISDRMASVGMLAAGVAHEINNPLAYVLANVNFALDELRRGAMPSDELITALGEAQVGAERVRVIVRDLKSFSHQGDDARVPVDVHKVLQAALSMAGNEIRHRAQLVRQLDPVPDVLATEGRLGQVFLNLLVNAAQAIPPGAVDRNEIRVCTRAVAGKVIITIQDTGPGIPSGILARIFEPFFTTKDVGVGTGLGLAICQGIVHGMGGQLEVETEVGKGSRFSVILQPTSLDEIVPEPVASPMLQIKRRVLVIDDEALVGSAVRRILGSAHEVVVATTARAALERIGAGEQFDVLLCDVMMPAMTGIELFHDLQRNHPREAARTIFMTGGAFTDGAMQFLDTVGNARLDKPFDPDALRRLVQTPIEPE